MAMTTILGVLDRPREQTTVLYVLTCFREVEIPISEVQLSDIQPEAGRVPFLVAGKPWILLLGWFTALRPCWEPCHFRKLGQIAVSCWSEPCLTPSLLTLGGWVLARCSSPTYSRRQLACECCT